MEVTDLIRTKYNPACVYIPLEDLDTCENLNWTSYLKVSPYAVPVSGSSASLPVVGYSVCNRHQAARATRPQLTLQWYISK